MFAACVVFFFKLKKNEKEGAPLEKRDCCKCITKIYREEREVKKKIKKINKNSAKKIFVETKIFFAPKKKKKFQNSAAFSLCT